MNQLSRKCLQGLLIFIWVSLCPIMLWSFNAGPYAGLALEYQLFRGDRKDAILSGLNYQTTCLPEGDFTNAEMGFEGYVGWLYPIFDRFLIGWETYLAYDFNKHTTECNAVDDFLKSKLRRNFNAGLLFRGGMVVWKDYFIYGLVGPDVGYFNWTQVQTCDTGTDKHQKKKAIMGIRFGAGIERQFSCFRVGLQVDYIQYNPQSSIWPDKDCTTVQSHFRPNILNVGMRFSVPLR